MRKEGWQWDDTAREVTLTLPSTRKLQARFNSRGLPSAFRRASDPEAAPSVSFTGYDAEGRLTAMADSVGTVGFTYHANGLLESVTEGGRTTTRRYNTQNRLELYTDGEGRTISCTYHPSGELKELTYPGGRKVTYNYDAYGRLWTVTDWNNRTTTYEYWENNLLRRISRPNGTTRELSYDAAGRLLEVRELRSGVVFHYQRLTYDADGRIRQSLLMPMPAAITLPFDTLDYDVDNRLSKFNGADVQVDEDGNLRRGPAVNGTIPSTANFTYDARNRLTSHGGSTYRYNPDGLRVEATGLEAATYVVDPNAALSRTLMRTKNGRTTYYIYGHGLLYECDVAGNDARYYHADQVGSTVALTDQSGQITDRWSYAPYGTEFRVSGTTDTPFRFNGEAGVMTDGNGLVYMRARYYHPRLMRFLNADPIGFGGGMNWYAFAGNDPISNKDPSGLLTETEKNQILRSAAAGGAVAGGVFGGIAGGTGGALLGAPTGPGAILAGGAGATAGAIEGAAIGTTAGLAIGGVTIVVVQKAQELVAEMGKMTGKEKASDVPSWVRQRGERPGPGENGKSFAERVMDSRYGKGNWNKGDREYSQIKKWGDRAFGTVVGLTGAGAANEAEAAQGNTQRGPKK